MPRTREEHLEFCKVRAREYLAVGDVKNAITSMLSDLDKHPETGAGPMAMYGMQLIMSGCETDQARKFIEGFR